MEKIEEVEIRLSYIDGCICSTLYLDDELEMNKRCVQCLRDNIRELHKELKEYNAKN